MSDEFYIARSSNVINTETERIVKATQVIVNVTKKIRSTRIAFAREYKLERMRYFKFTHIIETTTRPPIVTVKYGYQIIPTNKNKVRKNKNRVQKYDSWRSLILFILSKYYAEHFSDSTLCVESSPSKSIKLVPKCHLTILGDPWAFLI